MSYKEKFSKCKHVNSKHCYIILQLLATPVEAASEPEH